MSDAPEWVDPTEPEEAPRPPTERDVLVEAVSMSLIAMKQSIVIMANQLLRLDEIGEPVSRSRTRVTKLEEARNDLQAHFDYDLVQKMGRATRDQRARAERHELS